MLVNLMKIVGCYLTGPIKSKTGYNILLEIMTLYNGIPHGPVVLKHNDLELIKYNFNRGVLNGRYEHKYINGLTKERCHYFCGLIHGLYESWYDDGNPKEKTIYEFGIRIKTERWIKGIDVIIVEYY